MKDKECVGCKKLFDCKGKPSSEPCINYQPRDENRLNELKEKLEKYNKEE